MRAVAKHKPKRKGYQVGGVVSADVSGADKFEAPLRPTPGIYTDTPGQMTDPKARAAEMAVDAKIRAEALHPATGKARGGKVKKVVKRARGR